MKEYELGRIYKDIVICDKTANICILQEIKSAYSKIRYDLYGNKTVIYYCELPIRWHCLKNELRKVMDVRLRDDDACVIVGAYTNDKLKKFIVPYTENGNFKFEKTKDPKKRISCHVRIITK